MSILFKNVEEQRKYLKKVQEKIHPAYKTGGSYYREFIDHNVSFPLVVVDAGCGDTGIVKEFKERIGSLIGVDVSKELLEKNTVVDQKIYADLEKVPLPDNSADMIVSEFVLEHLENPEKVFQELYRILKPGGSFIFLTPNRYNPIMVLSGILPHFIHDWFRDQILKKGEETHKTYYRANSYDRVVRLSQYAGFTVGKVARAGNPEYVGIMPLLMWPAMLFERMINNRVLEGLKMYLIGEFKK
jgi:ubiquinone/menaquinone biosynthesis C-methylase UbiE